MNELNCLGDYCPIPLMKLQNLKHDLKSGEQVKLITDHSCVCESVIEFCRKMNYQSEVIEPINGIWEIYITNPNDD